MRAIVLLLGLTLLTAPARAEDETAAARAAISGQADALGRDDAAGAYSFAAPNVQSVFPGPEVFMGMVRQGYAPVYRHKSFEFGEAKSAEGKVVQRVHIVDGAGVSWEAIYTLEHGANGAMKITGCVLVKADQSV